MKKRTKHNRPFQSLKPILCLIVLFSLSDISVLRAQVRTVPVNLSYLSQRADIIVQGRVTGIRQEYHPDFANIPMVEVTLEVETMLRGPSGRTYTFREVLLGVKAGSTKQGYKVGQRLMLFLPTPSKYGLSSPVGVGQGRFHITRLPGGRDTIANEVGNVGLFKDVENRAFLAGINLSVEHMRTAATKQGPVSLADFASLVKALTALPRIR